MFVRCGSGARWAASLFAALVVALGSAAAQGTPVLWAQQAKLRAGDAVQSGFFGCAVSAVDGTLVAGAHNTDQEGAVYVFVGAGVVWSQEAELHAADEVPGSSFGDSVAASGDTILVGDCTVDNGRGAAYVFVRDGGVWAQQGKLAPPGSGYYDRFCKVALSGDTAVVGAFSRRAAFAFVRNGTQWRQEAELVPSTVDPSYGYAVALRDDTAVVTSSGDSAGGAAYVFTRSGGTWSQQARLAASDGVSYNDFGGSVAISADADTVIVGALSTLVGAYHGAGAAYVFVREGTLWTEQAKLVAPTPTSDAEFGRAVGVWGDTAVVGAPEAEAVGLASGAAYVFTRTGVAWDQGTTVLSLDLAGWDEFGSSVALVGDTAVIGAPSENMDALFGAVYVFGPDTRVDGGPDANAPADAGFDAALDGGSMGDAGADRPRPPPDARVDSRRPASDARAGIDGPEGGLVGRGCACRIASPLGAGQVPLPMVLLTLYVIRWRARHRLRSLRPPRA